MKYILSLIAATLCLTNANAVGLGGGIIAGHPEYDYAWYTLDSSFNYYEPPYAKFVSGTLYLGKGADNLPYPGIYSPYVVYSSSTVPCNSGNGGTLKGSDTNHDMMWCDGSSWMDITTTLKNVVTSASTINSNLTSVSNSLLNYTLLTTYNAGLSGLSASLTTAINGKEPAIAAGTTSQYWRGDKTWQTLPVATRTFNTPTRSLNTAFQISTTQDAWVTYSVDINCSSPLLAGQSSTVSLQYADNSGMSTNLVTVSQALGSVGGILNVNNGNSGLVTGMVPAGKYVRITSSGSCTVTYQRAQEVLF